jgi:prepilin-type N-terminal cleavage/methylation domain-containing protein
MKLITRHTHGAAETGTMIPMAQRARRIRSRLSGEGGFTLVELLVVMVLAGIISVAVLMMLSNLTGVFNSQSTRMLNQDDARTAINEVARYIRAATSSADNQTSQTNSIATASPQEIEFYCDLNGDGIAEKVRYYLQGTTLKMQSVKPLWVLTPSAHWTYPAYTTDGVVIQNAVLNGGAALFRYYKNVSGAMVEFTPNTTALRQLVVSIGISLTVNEQPKLARGNVQLATNVEIRQRYQGGLE